EEFCQIFPARLLDRRTDIVVTDFLTTKQADDTSERGAYRHFSAFVFERNEKQRRLRKAYGALLRRIAQLQDAQPDFDRFGGSLVVFVQKFDHAPPAPGFAFSCFIDNNRRVLGKSLAETERGKRRRIDLLPEPIVSDRVSDSLEKFFVVNSQRQRRTVNQRSARESCSWRAGRPRPTVAPF